MGQLPGHRNGFFFGFTAQVCRGAYPNASNPGRNTSNCPPARAQRCIDFMREPPPGVPSNTILPANGYYYAARVRGSPVFCRSHRRKSWPCCWHGKLLSPHRRWISSAGTSTSSAASCWAGIGRNRPDNRNDWTRHFQPPGTAISPSQGARFSVRSSKPWWKRRPAAVRIPQSGQRDRRHCGRPNPTTCSTTWPVGLLVAWCPPARGLAQALPGAHVRPDPFCPRPFSPRPRDEWLPLLEGAFGIFSRVVPRIPGNPALLTPFSGALGSAHQALAHTPGRSRKRIDGKPGNHLFRWPTSGRSSR